MSVSFGGFMGTLRRTTRPCLCVFFFFFFFFFFLFCGFERKTTGKTQPCSMLGPFWWD